MLEDLMAFRSYFFDHHFVGSGLGDLQCDSCAGSAPPIMATRLPGIESRGF